MKVVVSESTLGPDYIGDVVVSCDRTEIKFPGSDEVFHMECIVDDANGEIYYYEPKLARYATDKLLHENDLDIWEVLKNPDLINEVFLDAHGDEFKEFAVKWNGLQTKGEDDEVYKTQTCRPIRGNFTEGNQIDSAIVYWKDSRIQPHVISQVHSLIEALYVLDGMQDSEPEGDLPEIDHIRIGNKDYDQAAIEQYRADLDDMVYDESMDDNPRDLSDSEGEVEIMWDTDEYEDFGIFKGDGSTYLIDYDRADTHDRLVDEVCRMIGKEYPDLDFGTDDFVIVNEDEFWEQRGGNPGQGEDDVVEKIPNWATTYIMYGDVPDNLTDEDIKLVDDFIDRLASQGIALISPIEGTESEFEPHPAFGDACDTTDWSCEKTTPID